MKRNELHEALQRLVYESDVLRPRNESISFYEGYGRGVMATLILLMKSNDIKEVLERELKNLY